MKEIIEINKVKEILIKNRGIIKEANIKFNNGLNVINGINGSGKSTVIKYLIELQSHNAATERTIFEIYKKLNKTTLLIDGPVSRFDEKKLIEILKELSESGRQVIITLNLNLYPCLEKEVKFNVINTSDFKNKE